MFLLQELQQLQAKYDGAMKQITAQQAQLSKQKQAHAAELQAVRETCRLSSVRTCLHVYVCTCVWSGACVWSWRGLVRVLCLSTE